MRFVTTSYISVPVADLRAQPVAAVYSYDKDPHMESQLLYGEPVRALGEPQNGWQRVEALEQTRFRPESGWHPYPGWVQSHQIQQLQPPKLKSSVPLSCVSIAEPWVNVYSNPYWEDIDVFPNPDQVPLLTLFMGTRLDRVACALRYNAVLLIDGSTGYIRGHSIAHPKFATRWKIVQTARMLLGQPYLWGGRSAYYPEGPQLTSCDCSGLVNLSFRVQGLDIPRDAHDQFLKTKPLVGRQLQSADLIFLAPLSRPERKTHVMLAMGGERFIDSNGEQGVVQESAQKRFGVSFASLSGNDPVKVLSTGNEYCISFGQIL